MIAERHDRARHDRVANEIWLALDSSPQHVFANGILIQLRGTSKVPSPCLGLCRPRVPAWSSWLGVFALRIYMSRNPLGRKAHCGTRCGRRCARNCSRINTHRTARRCPFHARREYRRVNRSSLPGRSELRVLVRRMTLLSSFLRGNPSVLRCELSGEITHRSRAFRLRIRPSDFSLKYTFTISAP